jgi:hypothetical protein
VCGTHVDALFGFCLRPSAEHAAARKNERVRPVAINDGEFQRSNGAFEIGCHMMTAITLAGPSGALI